VKTARTVKPSLTRLAYPALISLTVLVYSVIKLLEPARPAEASQTRARAVAGAVHQAPDALDAEQDASSGQTSLDDVQRRLDKYITNHYLDLHVAVLSVTLGVAGLVAAGLLTNHELGAYRPVFGMLWIASLLGTLAVYSGTVTGAIALPSRVPSMLDLIPPVLMSVVESLLFAVLAPQLTGTHPARKVVAAWFLCLAIFCVLAVFAIFRARHHYQTRNFTEDLKPSVASYRKILAVDIVGASATAVAGATSGAIQLLHPQASLAAGYWSSGSVLTLLTLALLGHANSARHWGAVLRPGLEGPRHVPEK
jgi:hypothetical protein